MAKPPPNFHLLIARASTHYIISNLRASLHRPRLPTVLCTIYCTSTSYRRAVVVVRGKEMIVEVAPLTTLLAVPIAAPRSSA